MTINTMDNTYDLARRHVQDHLYKWMVKINGPSQYRYKRNVVHDKIDDFITHFIKSHDRHPYVSEIDPELLKLSYGHGIYKEDIIRSHRVQEHIDGYESIKGKNIIG